MLAQLLCTAAAVILFSACGKTFNTDDLGTTGPSETIGDTTYVLQSPIWEGFLHPTDVHVGFEPFIYVAEFDADRVTMLDLAGTIVGHSSPIRHPVAIGQDFRLNLLVCGEFDTTIDGRSVTFGAIYKIDLYASRHDISTAPIYRVFYDSLRTERRYTGIAVLPGNGFYVARTGPNNSSPVDPDDGIMLFDASDNLRPRVEWPGLSVEGTGLTAITQPTGITTFPRPVTDFVFTQKGQKSLFRTQWITQRTVGDVSLWMSYFTPELDGELDFLRIGLFDQPEDVQVDQAGNIYVVDAGLDSLFRFNSSGFITQAFGGPGVFSSPQGVAYFDRTLYVADTGNNRILRFILSTDLR